MKTSYITVEATLTDGRFVTASQAVQYKAHLPRQKVLTQLQHEIEDMMQAKVKSIWIRRVE